MELYTIVFAKGKHSDMNKGCLEKSVCNPISSKDKKEKFSYMTNLLCF